MSIAYKAICLLQIAIPLSTLVIGCGQIDEPSSVSETAAVADTHISNELNQGQFVTLLEFEGYVDPELGEVIITSVEQPGAVRYENGLATVEQAVGWCPVTIIKDSVPGTGPANSAELVTLADTVSIVPSECAAYAAELHGTDADFAEFAFRDLFGVLCAKITFRHFYNGQTWTNLYAEITEHTGGSLQYAFTPTLIPGLGAEQVEYGRNPPTPENGGLFYYGNVGIPDGTVEGTIGPPCTDPDPDNCLDESTVLWAFRRSNMLPFTFSGRMIAEVQEVCDNNQDDDCDLRLDNDCYEYPTDADCLSDADCQSGACAGASLRPEVFGTCCAPGDVVSDSSGLCSSACFEFDGYFQHSVGRPYSAEEAYYSDYTVWMGDSNAGLPVMGHCVNGDVLIGIRAEKRTDFLPVLGKVQAVCGTPSIDCSGGPCDVLISPSIDLPWRGSTAGELGEVLCPANEAVVALGGRAGTEINQIFLKCAPIDVSGSLDSPTWGALSTTPPFGDPVAGVPLPTEYCAAGEFATALDIMAATNINALRLGCQAAGLRACDEPDPCEVEFPRYSYLCLWEPGLSTCNTYVPPGSYDSCYPNYSTGWDIGGGWCTHGDEGDGSAWGFAWGSSFQFDFQTPVTGLSFYYANSPFWMPAETEHFAYFYDADDNLVEGPLTSGAGNCKTEDSGRQYDLSFSVPVTKMVLVGTGMNFPFVDNLVLTFD